MATPVSSVPEFCAILGRSKLLDDEDLRKIRERWTTEPNTKDSDVEGFRKFLVREKCLTEYQAALLQRGRAEGFLIGEYVILDRIGSGQSAGVYKAIHKSGQVVALKVLPASKARDENCLNRFQREGRLLTQLDHPNVVRAYQVGHYRGVHFIVMEHLEGETLDAVLAQRTRLPATEAARIVRQAYQGLQHLHEKRMVHRDLKPANLMLTPPPKADTLNCTVKILDIGIGRELFDENSPVTQDLHLTTEGALLGTPDYLAPEQARDARTSDVRSDIYSLGCLLYHLLTGRPPFTDKNVLTLMVKHATEVPTPVKELVPEVPSALSAVVDRLLRKKPDERPQTPAEVVQMLKPFLPAKAASAESSSVLPAYREWLASESAMELPVEVKSTGKPSPGAVPAPAPVAKSGPVPAAAVAKPTKSKSVAVPVASPVVPPTTPAPVMPAYQQPIPYPYPMPNVNVELVSDEEDEDEDDRSLVDLDRRDWMMLGAGGFLMLFAIGAGYGLTRLTRGKKPEEPIDPPK
jgi:serine/threonine protein kinase